MITKDFSLLGLWHYLEMVAVAGPPGNGVRGPDYGSQPDKAEAAAERDRQAAADPQSDVTWIT